MKVKLKVDMSGTRDGYDWPARGAVVDLPPEEAAGLCDAGMADPVADKAKPEQATVPDDAEQRAAARAALTRTARAKAPAKAPAKAK